MKSITKKTVYLISSSFILLNLSNGYAQASSPSPITTPFWQYQAGYIPPPPAGYNNNTDTTPSDITELLRAIKNYIFRFGLFFGYDLEAEQVPKAYNTLVNTTDSIAIESSVVKYCFSLMSTSIKYPTIVPQGGTYEALNSLVNVVYKNLTPNPALDVQSSQESSDSTSSQQAPMSPVSQAILNILSYTPEGYCITGMSGSTTWGNTGGQGCKFQYMPSFIMGQALGIPMSDNLLTHDNSTAIYNQLAILMNSSGPLSNAENWFPQGGNSGGGNNSNPQQKLLNQLDSSIFLTPLMYSTQSKNDQGSDQSSQPGSPRGLNGQSQLESAQNFIRYLTGSVLPPTLPSADVIGTVLSKISKAQDTQSQITNFNNFSSYLLGVRVYAARQSVALQNIYEMLGKRIPQNNPANMFNNQNPTSQALNEFIMASYRLFNPKTDGTTDTSGSTEQSEWQTKISGASSATVEKEMVILLAEINYQLYQMRQQQERMLLTETMMVLNFNNYPILQVSN